MTRIAYVIVDSKEYKELKNGGWKEVHRLDTKIGSEVTVKMALPDDNFTRLVREGEGRN